MISSQTFLVLASGSGAVLLRVIKHLILWSTSLQKTIYKVFICPFCQSRSSSQSIVRMMCVITILGAQKVCRDLFFERTKNKEHPLKHLIQTDQSTFSLIKLFLNNGNAGLRHQKSQAIHCRASSRSQRLQKQQGQMLILRHLVLLPASVESQWPLLTPNSALPPLSYNTQSKVSLSLPTISSQPFISNIQ